MTAECCYLAISKYASVCEDIIRVFYVTKCSRVVLIKCLRTEINLNCTLNVCSYLTKNTDYLRYKNRHLSFWEKSAILL
jgi:abortive infection bacteriophage resistance protein